MSLCDKRIRNFVFAERIVDCENVENAEGLLKEKPIQIGLAEKDRVIFNKKGYIILDFGKEMQGSVKLLTHLVQGKKAAVRIRLGESVAEVCAELNEKNATNDHSLRDVTTTVVDFSDMEFCQSGFRFARIDNLEDKKIYFKTIVAVSVMRDLTPIGKFTCNDKDINKIFDVASYTLMLNMQNYIWDGIKRDRLVWMGDLHPETKGITCLFGKMDIVTESLDFIKDQYPLPEFMNNMPAYSLWWIIITRDYCFETGDFDYLSAQLDYMEGLVKLIDEKTDEKGKFDFDLFFDWPTHQTEEEEAGVTAVCYMAMKKAKEVFAHFGKTIPACDSVISKIKDKNKEVKWAKQTAAFLVYSGLVSPEKMHDFLTLGGAKGMSTFMSYYILSAIADSGDYQTALSIMKEYYMGMINMGATAFWEDFDIDWLKNATPITEFVPEGKSDIHGDNGKFCYIGFRHSLCHGWACGPIQYLLHYVAGFNIDENDPNKVIITPHLDGLENIDATFPVGQEKVELHAELKGDKTYVKVISPHSVKVELKNCIEC